MKSIFFAFFILAVHICFGQNNRIICHSNADENSSVEDIQRLSYACERTDKLVSYLQRIKRLRGVPSNKTLVKKLNEKKTASAYYWVNEADNNKTDLIISINQLFFENSFTTDSQKEAILIWVLAHELSHHLDGDIHKNVNNSSKHNLYIDELIADKDGGYAVGKLTNMNISFLDSALPKILSYDLTHMQKHPATIYRCLAAKAGFIKAKLESIDFGKEITIEGVVYSKYKFNNDWGRGVVYFVNNNGEKFRYEELDDNAYFTCGKLGSNGKYNNDAIWYKEGNSSPYLYLGTCDKDIFACKTAYLLWEDSDVYFGEYKNGYRNGKGTYYFKSGDKYVGDWVDGNMEGVGIYYYSNQNEYHGLFIKDKRHGRGILLNGNKVLNKGCWENDVYIGEDCK